MTSGEGLDLPFRLLCVPCDPTLPPGVIFRRVLEVILKRKYVEIGVDFVCVCSGCLWKGVVERFWECLR